MTMADELTDPDQQYAPNDPAKQAASTGSDVTGFTASTSEPSVSSTIGQYSSAEGVNQFANPLQGNAVDRGATENLNSALAEPDAPSAPSAYDVASAERNRRAGGTGTYEGDSAARQERAGGAATFAQESEARNERALPSRTAGQTGPDSLDRDRTGRISKDEMRAAGRAVSGTSRSSYDIGKVNSVLARLKRNIGGQPEVDRQMDQLFESGQASQASPQKVDTQAAQRPVEDDVTDAIGLEEDSLFNVKPTLDPISVGISDRVSTQGLSGFSI